MKKIIKLFICFIFLNSSFTFGQNVSKDFLDGEVYVKIKKEILFVFDTLHREVDIKSKLPFLVPLISKYNITKAEASFYFSKSDILKRTFRIHFSKNELIDKLIAELKNINQIEYIEKIPLMRITYTPNDLLTNEYSGQYALYNIHAQDAWDVTRGNKLVKVAIVDNAIEINHPDLSANVTHHWDVSDDDANPTPPNLNSKWDHGTHTSGIACATSDNGTGIASIGYYCGLMAVKATGDDDDPDFIYDGYEGIDWAVSNGAEVISCSWGGLGFSQTGQNTIDDAYDNNVIVVASAGNDNGSTISYPAGYNHVVAVASVNKTDIKASDSNFGSWVDVSAPGVGIWSTLPNPNKQYGAMGGTSMAAPMVAGLCGLIRYINPGLSYNQVVSHLVNTTDNIDAQNPTYIGKLGSGRINAYRAVESALTCNPTIHLGSGVYTILKTQSSGIITSANTIPAGKQVTFDAAVKVDLVAGFIATNGSVFRAYIEGCNNSFSLNYQSKKQRGKNDETAINKKEINTPQNSLAVNTINVFPNPANGKVNIRYQLGKVANVALHLYNSKGIAVYQAIAGKKLTGIYDISINVSGFAPGPYLMELKTDDDVKMTKLIIIH